MAAFIGEKFEQLMSSYLGGGKKAPLKTIQPTVDGNVGSPKGKTLKKPVQNRILVTNKPVKVFEDKKRVFQEIGVQTERHEGQETGTQTDMFNMAGGEKTSVTEHNDSGIDQEAYDLMVKDPIPESYWKELAEERRLSLAEALSENEMLHQSIDELKEENLNLSQMAGQAEYFASVLNDLVGDEEEKETEEQEGTQQEETSEDSSDPVDQNCADADSVTNSEEEPTTDSEVISNVTNSEHTDSDKKDTEELAASQETGV